MVDMAAIAGAAGALKTALDLAKAALGMHDAALIRAKVTEMQGEISSALASAITAQMDQVAVLKRVGDLEKEVASFEKWDAEKDNYDLKTVASTGMLAYMLKPETRGSHPPHWICTKYYQNRKPSIVQPFGEAGRDLIFKCHECAATFRTHGERPAWLA
jgi:hypothetical protein